MKSFNFHKISTLILIVILLLNINFLFKALEGFVFGKSWNERSAADVTFVLNDTTFTWSNVTKGTLMLEDVPCSEICEKKFVSATLEDGSRYVGWDITEYKEIKIDFVEAGVSTVILK